MKYSDITTEELGKLLKMYNHKVQVTPECVTSEDVNDSWDVMFEFSSRLSYHLTEQEQQLDEIKEKCEKNSDAVDFILEYGLFEEFQEYRRKLKSPKLYIVK